MESPQAGLLGPYSQHMVSVANKTTMLRVIILSVVILNVVILRVVMLSVVLLNVVMRSVVMLNVIILSVVMLNVVILSVVAPFPQPRSWPYLSSLRPKI